MGLSTLGIYTLSCSSMHPQNQIVYDGAISICLLQALHIKGMECRSIGWHIKGFQSPPACWCVCQCISRRGLQSCVLHTCILFLLITTMLNFSSPRHSVSYSEARIAGHKSWREFLNSSYNSSCWLHMLPPPGRYFSASKCLSGSISRSWHWPHP